MPALPRIPAWLLVFCSLGSTHCGPAARPATVEEVEYPTFTPAEAALFDDQFDEATLRPVPWTPDDRLRERVLRADSVVVARVKTVSEEASDSGPPTLVVELLPWGEPLAGRRPEGVIRLELAPSSPSYRLFHWQRRPLLGKDVVLLYRHYMQDGELRVHFRAEPNLDVVHLAIQGAVASAP